MRNPFSAYHPAVAFVFLVAAIGLAMAAFQPVYAVVALMGAFSSACLVRGIRRTVRAMLWIVPGVLLIAGFNMLFTSAGTTVLFAMTGRSFYLEALLYGATTGVVFAAMMLWFTVYAAVMDSEATAALMGRALPTVSLMVSQVMRLVPQFIRRGRSIASVQDCATAARPCSGRQRAGVHARSLSVLMGWGMEDGIVRSDAMRARGYGCTAKRTRYRRQRFKAHDAMLLSIIVILGIGNALLASVACSQFSFYPYMDTLVVWWGYLPYLVFVCLPLALGIREALAWR